MGKDGQKGTLLFRQGTQVPILPDGSCDVAHLKGVEFCSFQLRGAREKLGLFRYKEGAVHKEIWPGQVGERVFKAQLLAKNAGPTSVQPDATEKATRRSRRTPTAAEQNAASLTERKRKRGATQIAKEAKQPVDCDREKRDAEQKALRAARDREIAEACIVLQDHPDWLEASGEPVEKAGRTLQVAKLSAAAHCSDFGEQRYKELTRVSFARCVDCNLLFISVTAGSRHRCKPASASVEPLQRQRQAPELLQGGVQLDTALLAEAIFPFENLKPL